MARAKPHYLKACFAAFREVSAAMYGTPFNLAAIEREVATTCYLTLLRSGCGK